MYYVLQGLETKYTFKLYASSDLCKYLTVQLYCDS